ncbi:MAG: diacylglycerol kinase [Gammaproteobacteria bacterium]|nr:diacylglycerol kinase [Gammaproteobacteria bacterium]
MTGPARMARAFGSSWRGFAAAWRAEEAFRQECLLALIVVPLGLWLGKTGIERVLLVAPMLLVLTVELLNSAVEAIVDRIGTERHPLSGIAKELGSAAVFVAFAILGLTWLLVLLERA